jgi:DNA processing protein
MESVADISYIMQWETDDKQTGKQRSLFVELSEIEQEIVNVLTAEESLDIDTLAFRTQLPPSILSMNLLNLEFQNMIKTLPGKRYMLI